MTFSKARQVSKNVIEKKVIWELKIVNTVSSFSTSHRHISDTLRLDYLRLSLFIFLSSMARPLPTTVSIYRSDHQINLDKPKNEERKLFFTVARHFKETIWLMRRNCTTAARFQT